MLLLTSALPAQSPTLQRPSAARIRQLVAAIDRHQLPPDSDVTPFPSQTFELKGLNTQTLGLVPVYFYFDPTGPVLSEQCGIFFVQPNGTSSYVPVVGPDPLVFSSTCSRVVAVGDVPHDGPHPRLIVICRVEAPNRRDYTTDFLLVWDAKQQRYSVDNAMSDWIASQLRVITIAGVRNVLAKNHR
jgi:hypothetical protein